MSLDKRRKEFFRVVRKRDQEIVLQCNTYEECLEYIEEHQLTEDDFECLKFTKNNKDVQLSFFFLGDKPAGAVIRDLNDPGFVATVGGMVAKN